MLQSRDMQRGKSFFLSSRWENRKEIGMRVTRNGIDGLIINDFNSTRGSLQEISR